MYAVNTPNTPTFSEHFNPALRVGVLTTNPNTGVSYEEEMTIEYYLTEHRHDDFSPAGADFPTVADLMKAFDIDGYYATPHTTIFPLTDNYKNS